MVLGYRLWKVSALASTSYGQVVVYSNDFLGSSQVYVYALYIVP